MNLGNISREVIVTVKIKFLVEADVPKLTTKNTRVFVGLAEIASDCPGTLHEVATMEDYDVLSVEDRLGTGA